MSLNADAAILLRDISGSWIQRTNKGTAPASTTAWESSETRMLKFFVTNLDIFDVVLLKQWEVQIYRILARTNKDSSKTVLYDSHIINYICISWIKRNTWTTCWKIITLIWDFIKKHPWNFKLKILAQILGLWNCVISGCKLVYIANM